MIETTIALKLPVRRVLLGNPTAPAPHWLTEQHRELASLSSQQLRSRHPARRTPAEVARQATEQQLRDQQHQLQQQTESLKQAVQQLHKVAGMLRQRWEEIVLPEVEHLTVELAHAIASKLVMDRLLIGEFPIENLVQQVLQRLSTDGPVVVKLHPEDLAQFRKRTEQHLTQNELGDNIKLQADTSLSRGDCQATAGEVSILYDLKRHIEELRQQLQP